MLNATKQQRDKIKTTMRYYLTHPRMATRNKSTNKCWRGCGDKGILLHAVAATVGMYTVAATVENSMEFPQKNKNVSAF